MLDQKDRAASQRTDDDSRRLHALLAEHEASAAEVGQLQLKVASLAEANDALSATNATYGV